MAELNRLKRQVLRQFQEHVNLTRQRRGVVFEQASTVDVYYHPRQVAAPYNYVTPRRGAAWVPGHDVKNGLDRLAALGRVPRLEMVKGLFPDAFHSQLKTIDLVLEHVCPLLTYGVIPGCDQVIADDQPPVPPTPRRLSVYGVADPNAMATWLRLNPIDTNGGSPDPREVKQLWANVVHGQEMYFLVSDDFTIAGGAGVILNPPVAEIIGADTLPYYRRRGVASAAIRIALEYAQARECTLIFAVGVSDELTRLYRHLGFVDLDQMITYYRPGEQSTADKQGNQAYTQHVAQSISTRR